MKLNKEQLEQISTGVERIEETEKGIMFHRFSKEEAELYKPANEGGTRDYYTRSICTAGIRLCFKTNSEKLYISATIYSGTSRGYFSLDVAVNGAIIGRIDNFGETTCCETYTQKGFPSGEFSKEFLLGKGEKVVTIYLPWSAAPIFKEISIDDESTIEPIKRDLRLLAYGDSITQGYDSLSTSNRYISRLCNMIGADELNKAIGGEIFFPELSAIKTTYNPDIITVAYGTNDFGRCDKETFKSNCYNFYKNLSENYPNAKIFALTPIWRETWQNETVFGKFTDIENCIIDAVSNFDNIEVIKGFDLVPKQGKFFADLVLHPNDEGFYHYAVNLYKAMVEKL